MEVPPAIWRRSLLLLWILQGWGQPQPHPHAPPWLLVDWVLWVVQARLCTWAVVVLADAHSPGGEQGLLCLPDPHHSPWSLGLGTNCSRSLSPWQLLPRRSILTLNSLS